MPNRKDEHYRDGKLKWGGGQDRKYFQKKKKKERFNGSYEVQVPKLSSSSNANMRRLYNISMVWYTTDSTYNTIPR